MGQEILGAKIGKVYGTIEYEGRHWRKSKASWPTGGVYQYEEVDSEGNIIWSNVNQTHVFFTPISY